MRCYCWYNQWHLERFWSFYLRNLIQYWQLFDGWCIMWNCIIKYWNKHSLVYIKIDNRRKWEAEYSDPENKEYGSWQNWFWILALQIILCYTVMHLTLPSARFRIRRLEFDPWVRKIPWRRKLHPLQQSCLDNSMTEEPGGLQSTGSQESNST